jgi:hypothetical protein
MLLPIGNRSLLYPGIQDDSRRSVIDVETVTVSRDFMRSPGYPSWTGLIGSSARRFHCTSRGRYHQVR